MAVQRSDTIGLQPTSGKIGRDIFAGRVTAIAAIPDGMASAVLVAVNSVFGLYNLMVGTPVAALLASSMYTAVIPRSLPTPTLPDLRVVPEMILPAIAIGLIGLIQATGVSRSYPNPDARVPPAILPDHRVTMLVPHGRRFLTGAADFEEEAPRLMAYRERT